MLVRMSLFMIGHRHEMHRPVFDTGFGNHFLSQRRDALIVAAHHDHLQAALVRGVHVHARHNRFVMLMLLLSDFRRQTAGVVIKTIAHNRHALAAAAFA